MKESAQRWSKLKRILFFCLVFAVLIASFLSLMLLTFIYIEENQFSFYLGSTLVIPNYILSFLPIPILGFFLVFTVMGLDLAWSDEKSKSLD
jgi:uncharacterized membrane protein